MYIRVGACALALSYVASGRLLAAYEPKVSPWDDLAGMLLVMTLSAENWRRVWLFLAPHTTTTEPEADPGMLRGFLLSRN